MIRFKHHDQLEIHRIEYEGVLAPDDLLDHAQFRADNPQWLNYDHLNVVFPRTDVSRLTRGALIEMRQKHRALFETHNLLILRRSAWICDVGPAHNLLQFWIETQVNRSDAYVDVRLFETFEEAGQWLVLGARESALAKTGEGFREIACFGV